MTVHCDASGQQCLVAGPKRVDESFYTIVHQTEDGGATWSTPYALEAADKQIEAVDMGGISGLYCDASGLKCMALRYRLVKQEHVLNAQTDVYTTENSGMVWEKTGHVDNTDGTLYESLSLLDCDKTGDTCVAIHAPSGEEDATADAYITHDRGQNWTHKAIAEVNTFWALTGIACDDSAVICQVVGIKDIYRVRDMLHAGQPNIQGKLQRAHLNLQHKAQN
ncbi:MAG: hypothetical protein QNK11_06270 [Legionella sp.]|nr:hypothetical protein [Legionella sp.]